MSVYLLFSMLGLLVSAGYLFWRLQVALNPGSGRGAAVPVNENKLKPEEKALLRLIRSVPKGKVTTYSVLARGLDEPTSPSHVARMVQQLASQKHLPWWRVVRKEGRRGVLPTSNVEENQRKRLVSEGVVFDEDTIPLRDHEWEP